MKRAKVLLLVGLMTMGLNLFKFFGALAAIAAAISAATGVANTAHNIWGEEEEPQRGGAPYRRSQFMPEQGQDQMQRYAPQNRQPMSGVSPDIMAYLRKYVR